MRTRPSLRPLRGRSLWRPRPREVKAVQEQVDKLNLLGKRPVSQMMTAMASVE